MSEALSDPGSRIPHHGSRIPDWCGIVAGGAPTAPWLSPRRCRQGIDSDPVEQTHKLGHRIDLQLSGHVAAMSLDCLLREAEVVGDLLVEEALADEPGDVTFARGERVETSSYRVAQGVPAARRRPILQPGPRAARRESLWPLFPRRRRRPRSPSMAFRISRSLSPKGGHSVQVRNIR